MEQKESDADGSVETSAQKGKVSDNMKRKFKSVADDDNETDTVDKETSLNGRISSKKKKKKKMLDSQMSQEDQKYSKPFLQLQLSTYFKENKKKDSRLKIRDIQGLVLYFILGNTTSEPPSWCQVAHRKNIKRVVVILLRAVGEDDFSQHVTCFPFITKELSSTVAPTIAAGTDFSFQHVHETLLSVPLSKSQLKKKRKRLQEDIQVNGTLEKIQGCNLHKEACTPKGDKGGTVARIDKSVHLLTKEQLKYNKYPLRCFDQKTDDNNGFLPCVTQDAPSIVNSDEHPVFAIDCEMCVTSEGYELTRISIVDESMNVLYDTLVMPPRLILDYKTKYSGITAETLEGVTVTLQDVQKQVQALLPHGAILAGHSLECDLNALNMYHNRIIDTAIAYQDRRGGHFKPALKFLAEVYLKKKIQTGSDGHCSIEDANACMELVKLKFYEGPDFGLVGNETEGLFYKMDCAGKKCSMLDYPYLASSCQPGGHHLLPCASDSEIVSKATNQIKKSDFTWIHLCGAQQYYAGLGKNVINKDQKEEVLKELDSRVRNIYEDIPENCLTLVIMGCGDVSKVIRLQKDPKPMKDELRKAVQEAKEGLCFMKIT